MISVHYMTPFQLQICLERTRQVEFTRWCKTQEVMLEKLLNEIHNTQNMIKPYIKPNKYLIIDELPIYLHHKRAIGDI
jgi:ribosome-interacting GTPase 1